MAYPYFGVPAVSPDASFVDDRFILTNEGDGAKPATVAYVIRCWKCRKHVTVTEADYRDNRVSVTCEACRRVMSG